MSAQGRTPEPPRAAPLPANEAGRLAALSQYAILDTEREAVFDDLAALAAQIGGVPVATVSFVDETREWYKAAHGLGISTIPRAVSFGGHVILSDAVLVVPDTSTDGRFQHHPLVTGPTAVRFYAGTAIRTSEGHLLGAVCLMDSAPRDITPQQRHALRTVSRQVAAQLELRYQMDQQVATLAQLSRTKGALEEQLRQAQKMEVVGNLTAGIVHDLNNVLTAVQAHAELVAYDKGTSLSVQADISELLKAVARGTAMGRKLMSFSRHEPLTRSSVPLHEVVTGLEITLRRVLPATIELVIVNEEGLPNVRADAGAVEQMVLNLANNARDAMPSGGLLRLETRRAWLDMESNQLLGWGTPGAYVAINVSDTGAGMDAETRSRVFEPFFTTKSAAQGTGLGLAMVFGLMKEHEGFVHVYSEPGQGTTFKLYFPVGGSGATAALGAKAASVLQGGSETILLVDDEDSTRNAAYRVLERFGYHVLTAPDGEEALTVFAAHRDEINLVLTDVVMPRMGGRELYERLRDTEVPFLFTSGYTARDVAASSDVDSSWAFLHKPWTLTELLQRVREVLDA